MLQLARWGQLCMSLSLVSDCLDWHLARDGGKHLISTAFMPCMAVCRSIGGRAVSKLKLRYSFLLGRMSRRRCFSSLKRHNAWLLGHHLDWVTRGGPKPRNLVPEILECLDTQSIGPRPRSGRILISSLGNIRRMQYPSRGNSPMSVPGSQEGVVLC